MVVGLLALARKAVALSYSREHEREADALGLKLIARCGRYDLQAGSKFMYRLHRAEKNINLRGSTHTLRVSSAQRLSIETAKRPRKIWNKRKMRKLQNEALLTTSSVDCNEV